MSVLAENIMFQETVSFAPAPHVFEAVAYLLGGRVKCTYAL